MNPKFVGPSRTIDNICNKAKEKTSTADHIALTKKRHRPLGSFLVANCVRGHDKDVRSLVDIPYVAHGTTNLRFQPTIAASRYGWSPPFTGSSFHSWHKDATLSLWLLSTVVPPPLKLKNSMRIEIGKDLKSCQQVNSLTLQFLERMRLQRGRRPTIAQIF